MPKPNIWYIANRFSGVLHKMVNGAVSGSCHIGEMHYERKARKMTSLHYTRLCKHCFSEELAAN